MNLQDLYLLILIMILANAAFFLSQLRWRAEIRLEHLDTAIAATNDFFNRAELLVKDPATPVSLKTMIFDIGLAVSDEEAGRKAMSLILKSLGDINHRGRVPHPRREILNHLDNLRTTRGDLYDAFNEALRAGFTAILLAHGQDLKRSKMALSYNATGSDRSRLLGLAESVDSLIAGWRDRGSDEQAACA